MSDHADVSDKLIEMVVRIGLNSVRSQPALVADGRCYFCDEKIVSHILFCNVDCRDDYEKEQNALRRAGR